MNIISNVNQSLNKIEAAFLLAITIFIVNKRLDPSATPAWFFSPPPCVLQGVFPVLFILTLSLKEKAMAQTDIRTYVCKSHPNYVKEGCSTMDRLLSAFGNTNVSHARAACPQ